MRDASDTPGTQISPPQATRPESLCQESWGPAAGADGGQDGQARGDGERGPAVGDPADVLLAAVAEHLGVGAAAVEPEHDPRAGPGGLLQLGQGRGQGAGQAGWLAGDEAHG